MKKLLCGLVLGCCMGAGVVTVHAQEPQPKIGTPENEALPSPRREAIVDVKGAHIRVTYGSPAVKGRKIMGGVVPYTEWWRTGANEATSFDTNADLMVGDLHVPAGHYTLVTLPSAGTWQLVVCKHTGQWGTERFAADDLGKTAMMKSALPKPQERMSITFEKTAGMGTQMHVKWETTDVWVPVKITGKAGMVTNGWGGHVQPLGMGQ